MMKSKTSTIKDIAESLNISISTVSRALQDHPRISAATIERVKKEAKKLAYRPNVAASNLRAGRTGIIGVIVPRINRTFFANVISGIESVAGNLGFKIMISQSLEDEAREIELVESLLNARADGILISISATTTSKAHFRNIQKAKTPLVFFDRAPIVPAPKVILDDYAGAFELVSELIQEGYRNILHFAGPQNIPLYEQRTQGYIDAMKQSRKTKFNSDFIIPNTLTIETGKTAFCEAYKRYPEIDAVFAASDFSCLGAYLAIRELGLSIGGDIGVAGFANEPFTALTSPSITSVEQNPVKMGEEAAKILVSLIDGSNSRKHAMVTLKPELFLRESTRKSK